MIVYLSFLSLSSIATVDAIDFIDSGFGFPTVFRRVEALGGNARTRVTAIIGPVTRENGLRSIGE